MGRCGIMRNNLAAGGPIRQDWLPARDGRSYHIVPRGIPEHSMHLRLNGLIAAVHTPLLDTGNVNLMVVERQSQHLLRGGMAGVFVCGTTGECHSLTVAERQQLTARWVS